MMGGVGPEEQFRKLSNRYKGATPESLVAVLCPILIPIEALDLTIAPKNKNRPAHATFAVRVTDENSVCLVRGRTGKFVPQGCDGDGDWKEIAKGRILEVTPDGLAHGEIYVGSGRVDDLTAALAELKRGDYLEIDQFGAAAKVLSALAEYFLVQNAVALGYSVKRMPEDFAQHLGSYKNYDFEFTKAGVTKKIEVKSLWGTNTSCARLIHSASKVRPAGDPSTWTPAQAANYYPTSSCKFGTQDIFAVSLFLRSGNIKGFAFARSVPRSPGEPYGLPACSGHPDHVSQNPVCSVGEGSWFATIDEVWNLP